jgi:hypothetical protein
VDDTPIKSIVKSIEVIGDSDAVDEMPIVQKVEETIRLGFNSEEGAKLLGMYDEGYRNIASLIAVRDRHNDSNVRKQAFDWLKLVDKKDGLGRNATAIKAFLVTTANTRHKKLYSWIKLRPQRQKSAMLDVQLKELLARPDIDEKVKKRVGELLNLIVDDRILSHFYLEGKTIIAAHRITKRDLSKKMNMSASFVHAIEHACKMCDNLADLERTQILKEERPALISRLCDAAHMLLEIQKELIGGENDGNQTQ